MKVYFKNVLRKRLASIFAVFCVLLGSSVAFASANDVTVKLTTDSSVVQGQGFCVTVKLEGLTIGHNIDSIAVAISYDEDKAEPDFTVSGDGYKDTSELAEVNDDFLNIDTADVFNVSVAAYNGNIKVVKVLWVNVNNPCEVVSAEEVLFSIPFKSKDDVTGTTDFEIIADETYVSHDGNVGYNVTADDAEAEIEIKEAKVPDTADNSIVIDAGEGDLILNHGYTASVLLNNDTVDEVITPVIIVAAYDGNRKLVYFDYKTAETMNPGDTETELFSISFKIEDGSAETVKIMLWKDITGLSVMTYNGEGIKAVQRNINQQQSAAQEV